MGFRLELIHEAAKGARRKLAPLLFVHGAFCTALCWQARFMPWLAEHGVESWALSLTGHGGSDGHERHNMLGIDDYVDDVASVQGHLPAPPVVIAHSMGGFVVQRLLHRISLPGLALLAPVPAHGLAGSTVQLLTQAPDLLFKLNLYQHGLYRLDIDELRRLLFSSDTNDEAIMLLAEQAQPESLLAIMDMSLSGLLPSTPLNPPPTLILGAGNDALIPRHDIASTARRFGRQAEFLPGLGHMMMLDMHWEAVVQRLFNWLLDEFDRK
ncbi:alpha/beta fold hydrolase [Crenobacter sp. SG2305]|uniref:alpha/beta hydrolase n=1 Tax=Crenobacter oryzisoli TaxID=3056844 RepID=UPI0025AA6B3E|nr:alpha/beta fold hydrolase [Crenobacter sp. SG2305]MDN0084567.1 alpha/beta fold hydrolase [Crenobacter sp. SG2305]